MKKHKARATTSKRVRAVMTVLLTTAALFAWTAPAQAAQQIVPTTLVAGKPNLFGQHINMSPQAKLTETSTGKPLAGMSVSFTIEGPAGGIYPVCIGVTNAQGVAKCGGLGAVLQIMGTKTKSYTAYFYGKQNSETFWSDSYDVVRFGGR